LRNVENDFPLPLPRFPCRFGSRPSSTVDLVDVLDLGKGAALVVPLQHQELPVADGRDLRQTDPARGYFPGVEGVPVELPATGARVLFADTPLDTQPAVGLQRSAQNLQPPSVAAQVVNQSQQPGAFTGPVFGESGDCCIEPWPLQRVGNVGDHASITLPEAPGTALGGSMRKARSGFSTTGVFGVGIALDTLPARVALEFGMQEWRLGSLAKITRTSCLSFRLPAALRKGLHSLAMRPFPRLAGRR